MIRRLYVSAVVLCLVFVSTVGGSLVTVLNWRVTLRAWAAFTDYVGHSRLGPYDFVFWQPARHPAPGIFNHDVARAYEGLTLYTSATEQRAFLIDMQGRVVHQWHLPFREAWPNPQHVDPLAEPFLRWDTAHLFPNGDLLAVYDGYGPTLAGYGLVKIDRDSRVVWKYADRAHHSVDVSEEGKVYVLTRGIREEAIAGIDSIKPPVVEDFVVILSPDGIPLERISILEAFRDSPYSNVLAFAPDDARGDVTHANEIEVITREIAAVHRRFEPGQALISLRELDTIAVIDPDKRSIVWAARGPWHRQHDPDFLPNGHMLVFDNLGHIGPGGRSRVIEFDPRTGAIVWQYAGSAVQPFDSEIMSGQQRLPNGNTLITEALAGRILEVAPDKTVVWEFRTPHRGGANEELVAAIGHNATRLEHEQIGFLEMGPSGGWE